MKLIAITGGIGSGKSVVSHVLRIMGYPVYDCDSEAKRLMVESPRLVQAIKNLLGDESYSSTGELNKSYISSRIFGHAHMVAAMNSLVHPAVLADIEEWAATCGSELAFVETALLNESNMTSIIDGVWLVTAPIELRIKRVAARSNISEEQIRARIAGQSNDTIDNARIIVNDGLMPILPQVVALLRELQ